VECHLVLDEGQNGHDDDGAEYNVGEEVKDGREEEDHQQDHAHAKH
jgi:hypothetical protein